MAKKCAACEKAKMKKMQSGGSIESFLKSKPSKSDSARAAESKKAINEYRSKSFNKDVKNSPISNAAKTKTMAKGGSFPDLNKDGKVTKADILKGRGVIKKMGGPTKKK